MTAPALPSTFHVVTPHGEVGLWWLHLHAPSREAQRQSVRQQAAHILDRQFPPDSLAHIHWPPGVAHIPDLAYAVQAWPPATHTPRQTPDLWLSWSYMPAARTTDLPRQALLAIAPFPVGVDVSAGWLLPQSGWAEVLHLYGGVAHAPADTQACARLWTGIESADKCLRTGLREWSAPIAAERARCTPLTLPLPHADIAAALAWQPPAV